MYNLSITKRYDDSYHLSCNSITNDNGKREDLRNKLICRVKISSGKVDVIFGYLMGEGGMMLEDDDKNEELEKYYPGIIDQIKEEIEDDLEKSL